MVKRVYKSEPTGIGQLAHIPGVNATVDGKPVQATPGTNGIIQFTQADLVRVLGFGNAMSQGIPTIPQYHMGLSDQQIDRAKGLDIHNKKVTEMNERVRVSRSILYTLLYPTGEMEAGMNYLIDICKQLHVPLEKQAHIRAYSEDIGRSILAITSHIFSKPILESDIPYIAMYYGDTAESYDLYRMMLSILHVWHLTATKNPLLFGQIPKLGDHSIASIDIYRKYNIVYCTDEDRTLTPTLQGKYFYTIPVMNDEGKLLSVRVGSDKVGYMPPVFSSLGLLPDSKEFSSVQVGYLEEIFVLGEPILAHIGPPLSVMDAFLTKHRAYFLKHGLPPCWVLNPEFDRIWKKIQNKKEKPISSLGNHKKEIAVIPKSPKKQKPPIPIVRSIDIPSTKTITYPKPKLKNSNVTDLLIGEIYPQMICNNLPDGVFLWIGVAPLNGKNVRWIGKCSQEEPCILSAPENKSGEYVFCFTDISTTQSDEIEKNKAQHPYERRRFNIPKQTPATGDSTIVIGRVEQAANQIVNNPSNEGGMNSDGVQIKNTHIDGDHLRDANRPDGLDCLSGGAVIGETLVILSEPIASSTHQKSHDMPTESILSSLQFVGEFLREKLDEVGDIKKLQLNNPNSFIFTRARSDESGIHYLLRDNYKRFFQEFKDVCLSNYGIYLDLSEIKKSQEAQITLSIKGSDHISATITSSPTDPYYIISDITKWDRRLSGSMEATLRSIFLFLGGVGRTLSIDHYIPPDNAPYRMDKGEIINLLNRRFHSRGNTTDTVERSETERIEYLIKKIRERDIKICTGLDRHLISVPGSLTKEEISIYAIQTIRNGAIAPFLEKAPDHIKILYRDESLAFMSTGSGHANIYNRIRKDTGARRLQKYLILRMVQIISPGILKDTLPESIPDWAAGYIQDAWAQIDKNVQDIFLSSLSKDQDGRVAQALDIKCKNKAVFDILLSALETNEVKINYQSPGWITLGEIRKYSIGKEKGSQ